MSVREIAEKLDLDKLTNSWRGDCPACAYPRVFSLKRGKNDTPMMYCSNGCNREAIHHAVDARLGSLFKPGPAPEVDDVNKAREGKKLAVERLWNGSDPAPGTQADAYLISRGLPGLAASNALRYRGDCQHPEGGKYPALVAHVVDVVGKHLGCHRTYVAPGGRGKANVVPDKASLGPIWGGAVRLQPALPLPEEPYDAHDVEPRLVIGEGIESSASAGVMLNLPAWAALSAGNLAKGLVLPASIRFVVIAADHDATTRAGQRAADEAAKRWRGEGRAVRICAPDKPGTDFNDLLRERGNG